jgi:ribosomal protein L24
MNISPGDTAECAVGIHKGKRGFVVEVNEEKETMSVRLGAHHYYKKIIDTPVSDWKRIGGG